jgi:hypothetical protein
MGISKLSSYYIGGGMGNTKLTAGRRDGSARGEDNCSTASREEGSVEVRCCVASEQGKVGDTFCFDVERTMLWSTWSVECHHRRTALQHALHDHEAHRGDETDAAKIAVY